MTPSDHTRRPDEGGRDPRGPGFPLPILMYHSIGPSHGDDLVVPQAVLRDQLSTLSIAGYRLTGLTEAMVLSATGTPVVGVTFDDAFPDFVDAMPVLADLDATATLYVPVANVGTTALDWPALHDLARAGIEIGSHSMIHEPLDVLPRDDMTAQVRASRDRLAAELGVPVPSFAYPHGYHSSRVRSAVAAAGYETACEVGRRLYRTGDDRYAIPRLQPTPAIDGERLLRMVRGEIAVMPAVKRLAQPGWRLTRRLARSAGVRLT